MLAFLRGDPAGARQSPSPAAGTGEAIAAGIIFVYCAGLQLARLFLRPLELFHDSAHLSFVDGIAFVGSTLLFQAAFVLFAYGLTGLCHGHRARKVAAWSVKALAVLIAVLETAGHAYYFETGSTLDYPLVAYSTKRLREISMLALRSLSPLLLGGLISAVAAVVLLPWISRRFARGAAEPLVPRPGPRSRRMLFAASLLASVPLGASGLLTRSEQAVDRATIRDPVLNVMATLRWHRGARPHFSQSRLDDEPVAVVRTAAAGALQNVVIVVLESARAESLTPWNPSLPDAPFLAELAKSSLRFDRFYTVQTHTSRALRAILCGFEPQHRINPPKFTHGIITHCLPNLLRDHGFQTVFFQTAEESVEHRTFVVFSMGYHEFKGPSRFSHEGFERANYLGYDDESMLAPTRKWLAEQGHSPFLATYLTVNAHYHCALLTRHGTQRYSADEDLNCYLNALRADDFFLRELFDEYKAAGRYRNTLFVIVADHGEGFGEHSRRTHNDVPYEEALRVPLLLHDPTATLVRPGVRADPASQLDIVPTVLALLGFKVASGHFQGSSLLVPHPQVPIRASCYDPETCLSRVQGDEKFIHHFGRRPDELFDLARDPGEATNLAGLHPRRVAELRRDLLDWDRRIGDAYAAVEPWKSEQRPAFNRGAPSASR